MTLWFNRLVAGAMVVFAFAAAPASQPVDPKLWEQMKTIDARSAQVVSLSADFRQEKFTPMLKKPLVSTGTVVARPDAALWTTAAPAPTVMSVTAGEIRIYYPAEKIVEVYPVAGQLAALAASPLPRLDVLQKFFAFEPAAAKDLDPAATDSADLAVTMTPLDEDLKKHVSRVRVLLDRRTGTIRAAENTDTDGDRTLLTFSNVRAGAKLADDATTLKVPAGTQEVHPLPDAAGGKP